MSETTLTSESKREVVLTTTWIRRSVLPVGDGGIAVGIPAPVRDELEIEAGKGGDKVDLVFDRQAQTLTIHFVHPEDGEREVPT